MTTKEVTSELMQAYRSKQPVEFIRHRYTLDEDTAYAVQEEFVKQRCELEKATVAGYKISMTSDDTQAIAQTDEPAYGTLLTTDILTSGEHFSFDALFSPLVETEIIFILTDDLTLEASEEEILQKSTIAAGIEIPDSRYVDWFPNFSLADLLSDNAATGKVVVSKPMTPPDKKGLESIKMTLYHDNVSISEGVSSEVLGNPVSAVAWLSHKLAKSQKLLKKGMHIASGTFIPPVRAEKGTYRASFSGLGDVEITFR